MQASKPTALSWLATKLIKTQIQHFRPVIKITPFVLINKIQQAKPSYKSNLINKQIAYDVIIDTQQKQSTTQKIKNCICASRPNSQIFKRISKQFSYNLKNGVNQLLFFSGRQLHPRLQTSIGLPSNPGLFMIAAIAILDQKYRQHHERCDVQFSFLQFREGQLYDLLNYTQSPLKMQQNIDLNTISFNQQFVKVFTFLDFIKLFKIALFNNKQRDLKTQTTFKTTIKQLKSSFIMKIRTKQYNLEGELILQQETALVDYDEGCYNAGKQKQGKSLLDYLLIQINNSNPNSKQIHYHMVSKNLFINFFKNYLKVPAAKSCKSQDGQSQHTVGGQLIFINSISSNREQYSKNSAYLQNIYASVGEPDQAKVFQKNRWNNYFNRQFTIQKYQRITQSIKSRNYSTLSQFYQIKQFYNEQVKKIKKWIKQYKNVINSYSVLKRELKCLQNVNIGFHIQLVGSCIKSDNFKDFYNSKSYISLGRQILMKTQNVKSEIMECFNQIFKIRDEFATLRKKEMSSKNQTIIPQIIKVNNIYKQSTKTNLSNLQNKNKFKPLLTSNTIHIQFNQFETFSNVRAHLFQYLYKTWNKINMSDERTLIQELIFQQSFGQELQNMNKILNDFVQRMDKIQQNQIICHKGDLILSRNNFYNLVKSFNLTKQTFLKSVKLNSKQIDKKNPLTDKKARKSNIQLPKLNKNMQKLYTQVNFNKLQDKQNSYKRHTEVIQVKGKIDFAKMMINPSQF